MHQANIKKMAGFFKSKKGVSPLIATILLIAFAVALGSVVMNWGLSLELGKSGDKCRNVDIRIREADASEVCYGGVGQNGYINFIIDNAGSEINGMSIWIIGEKGTSLFDVDNILIKKGALYEKENKEVTYDFSTYGSIKQVQFIPKIRIDQSLEICPKNAVKAEKIGICSQ
ncbi:hypothetical protein HYW20_08920 [Candidatus Woesearchaeota archaeon]|nr:hypothetical protein [Candidatus Woesearchaeota archaeon]